MSMMLMLLRLFKKWSAGNLPNSTNEKWEISLLHWLQITVKPLKPTSFDSRNSEVHTEQTNPLSSTHQFLWVFFFLSLVLVLSFFSVLRIRKHLLHYNCNFYFILFYNSSGYFLWSGGSRVSVLCEHEWGGHWCGKVPKIFVLPI